MPASTYTLPPPYFGPENALGVLCSDSINPHTTNAWRRSAWTNPGYFGQLWGWFGSPCARWPGRDADRYIGPWDIDTENPILVASTRYDPSTPYQGARRVNELFGNTILLTVNGWGHTTPFLSRCADLVVERYLLRGDSRSDDMWCPQDVEPFPEPVVGAGGAAVAAETDGVTTAVDPRGALLDRATTALPGR